MCCTWTENTEWHTQAPDFFRAFPHRPAGIFEHFWTNQNAAPEHNGRGIFDSKNAFHATFFSIHLYKRQEMCYNENCQTNRILIRSGVFLSKGILYLFSACYISYEFGKNANSKRYMVIEKGNTSFFLYFDLFGDNPSWRFSVRRLLLMSHNEGFKK